MDLVQVRRYRNAILALADRHGARDVRIFGSVVRGEAGPESDIDFLVELAPGRTLLDWGAFWQDLEKLLGRLPTRCISCEPSSRHPHPVGPFAACRLQARVRPTSHYR